VSDAAKPFLVVVIVLLVLAALFVIGPTINATRSEQDNADLSMTPEHRQALRDRFFKPKPVTSAELSGCPVGNGTLRVLGACTATVGAVDSGSRELILVGERPAKVHYAPKAVPKLLPMDFDLKPGKEGKFSIPKDGAALTLTCQSAEPCVFALGR
jgi:hypothetical protein